MKRALVVGVVSLSLSCSLLRQLLSETVGPPAASFGQEAVTSASLDRAALALTWVVTNPNPVSVELTSAQGTLAVEGKPLALGAPAPGLRVPPNGRAEVSFTADVRFQQLGLLGQPRARFRAQGSLSFSTPLGPQTLPLEHEGELAVPRPPEVAVALPRLTGLTLTGASLEVPVQVTNPNPFPLSFSLQGALEVGGVQPAAASTAAEEQVGASQTRSLALPAQVSFPAVAAAASALRSGSARVTFQGALRSGEVTVPIRFDDAFKLPRLELKGVSLGELSLEGATAVVLVAADNPTPIPIELGPSRLSLSIDGNRLAELQPPPGTRLAASGATELQLPLRFSFGSLISAAAALGKPRTAKLRVEGALALPTPIGVFQVPVDETRPLELPRLPELSFGSPRLGSVTLTSATVEVPVTVTNRNAFAVPAVQVGGSLAISGARVGQISSGDLGAIEAGSARTFTVPVTLDFLRTAAAAQAVRSGSAQLAFDGTVASGGLSLPLRWAQAVSFTR
ncbi:MAG TPA: LEA type 2 family protein [Myxococcales bacterium]|nr:LEA type 2 family protein [Myxococcales bacterium]